MRADGCGGRSGRLSVSSCPASRIGNRNRRQRSGESAASRAATTSACGRSPPITWIEVMPRRAASRDWRRYASGASDVGTSAPIRRQTTCSAYSWTRPFKRPDRVSIEPAAFWIADRLVDLSQSQRGAVEDQAVAGEGQEEHGAIGYARIDPRAIDRRVVENATADRDLADTRRPAPTDSLLRSPARRPRAPDLRAPGPGFSADEARRAGARR